MPSPGDELTDPATGARLRFVETAGSTDGARVTLELAVGGGWSAGPLHVHPAQTEKMRVLDGRFFARMGDDERICRAGDLLVVPEGTAHSIRCLTDDGALTAEFAPALRTDELFETMFRADSPRRPPAFVPSALRAWAESRGFGGEIRYLWPRRLAGTALAAALVLLLLRRSVD